MLVVTAQIWPGGDQDRAFVIGEIQAANISGLAPVSDYAVEISQLDYKAAGVEASDERFEFLHERRRGAWELVRGIAAHHQITKGDPSVSLGVVAERASQVLGGPLAAIPWLGHPCSALGDKQPLDLLDTREGVDRVLTLLGQLKVESMSDGPRWTRQREVLTMPKPIGMRTRAKGLTDD
jgi:hypothetical protein